jgi:hypothetical protein
MKCIMTLMLTALLIAPIALAELTTAIRICVPVQWEIATGPVVEYELKMDGNVIDIIPEPPTELCAFDLYIPHMFQVTGIDADGNYGPTSDSLEIQWEWNMDTSGNGKVGYKDFGAISLRVRQEFGGCNDTYIKINCEDR